MRIVFDQGTPVPLRKSLSDHHVSTAYELGWSTLKNGDLLDAAEAAEFKLLITTDRNLRYQQNLGSRKMAIIALTTTSWPRIQRDLTAVIHAVGECEAGSYVEINFPSD